MSLLHQPRDATEVSVAERLRLRAVLDPTVVGVSIAVVIVSLMGFFRGASGVLIRDDLGFNTARIGIAVSSFFAAGALLSLVGRRVSEVLGRGRRPSWHAA